MFVVYTELFENGERERWFYGCYGSRERANDVAYELGQNWETKVFHSICSLEEAVEYGIKNMPEKYMK